MMYCKFIICYNYYVDCLVLLFFFMIKSIFDLLLLFSKIIVDKKNIEEIYIFFFVGFELFLNICSFIKFIFYCR